MSLTKNNLLCQCFLTENYFVKSLRLHVSFNGKDDFLRSYQKILAENCTAEETDGIVKELEEEFNRRRSLGRTARKRRQTVEENYVPLHRHIYHLQEKFFRPEFCELVKRCRSATSATSILSYVHSVKGADRVYQMPVFTSHFCHELVEELSHFENSDMPKGRPNTMNNYGVNLDEMGFDEHFLKPFRELYLSPIAKQLFPDCGGCSLDSHRAFTVSYGPTADSDLDLHFDNGEVTANICLSCDEDSDAGGEVYFDGMRTDRKGAAMDPSYAGCQHRLGYGLMHRSQQLHGALPVAHDSSRCNLIIWMRSSLERNRLCPMCDRQPDLVETEGLGDGFSIEEVEVCSMV